MVFFTFIQRALKFEEIPHNTPANTARSSDEGKISDAEAGHGAGSTALGTGMLAPFNNAIREFNAQAKAIPRSWQTINHSSDLPKFSR